MNWLKPAPAKTGVSCAFALAAFCFWSTASEAFTEAAALFPFSETSPPLAHKVRHHRHRRTHFGHRIRAKESEHEKADAQKPELPSEDASTQDKLKETQPAMGQDKTASKPPEPFGPPPPPATWSAAEVEAGRMDCERRLSGLHALYDRLDPIREGACGSPSPIRLKAFDSERAPLLDFVPPPTISCKLAGALRRWFDDVVQPKAKARLHATIVRMNTLSGYDCRTRYDDPTQRISQHAYANALDISEFITAKGEHVAVADAWNAGDERAEFLHDIHDGACEIFGTSLGPDANEAHRNHFHFDMIERRRPLCDFTPAQARAREEAKKVAAASAAKVPVSGGDPATAKAETPVPVSDEEEPRGARHGHGRHRRRASRTF